jgi:hypothetical protein
MKYVQATLILCSLTFVAEVYAADVSGIYKCTGNDADASNTYETDLTISKTGDTFHFAWQGAEVKEYSGTGLFSKGASNVIASEFWDPKNQNDSGVIIYNVKSDGKLDGVWAIADKKGIGTETCNKQ